MAKTPSYRRRTLSLFTSITSGRYRVSTYQGKDWGYEVDPDVVPLSADRTPAIREHRRLRWYFFGAVAVLMFFTTRLFNLQIAQGLALRTSAEENRIRIKPIEATRGILYDRNGTPLVRNVPNLSLQAVPADLPKQEALHSEAVKLAGLLHEEVTGVERDLNAKRARSYLSVMVRDHLDYQTAIRIQLAEPNLPGLHIEENATREYLGGEAFSHIIGYTGKISQQQYDAAPQRYLLNDEVGKDGVERSAEEMLRGTDGGQQVEVDAHGRELRIVASESPIAGKNVTLSIDAGLQQQAYVLLQKTIQENNALGGAVAAIDPRNGAVLALVSAPSFDNNAFVRGMDSATYQALEEDPHEPLFNRAITGQFPSGSTIKPILAATALTLGVINEKTTVLSTGGITIGQWFFPDWKAGGHGVTDVRKALAWSVNTFFYTIGGGTPTFPGLGVNRLVDAFRAFGLGVKTGINLPGEASGLVPTPQWKQKVKDEHWYIGDTYHISIGQGDLLVTPLQMALATAAIANGGILYQPQLIAHTAANNQKAVITQPVITRQNLADPHAMQVVREGMRQAVTDGSAVAAKNVVVPVAGKTGTAQFDTSKHTHAWFIAFAPYENPEIALAVVVEGGGEGHEAALPVARDLLQWFFTSGTPVDKPGA